jgi:hypothetical protein
MEPDLFGGLGLVKVKGAHCLLHIFAHCLPGVPLREDVLRQAFGAEASIFLLRYFKYQFAHAVQITVFDSSSQAEGS